MGRLGTPWVRSPRVGLIRARVLVRKSVRHTTLARMPIRGAQTRERLPQKASGKLFCLVCYYERAHPTHSGHTACCRFTSMFRCEFNRSFARPLIPSAPPLGSGAYFGGAVRCAQHSLGHTHIDARRKGVRRRLLRISVVRGLLVYTTTGYCSGAVCNAQSRVLCTLILDLSEVYLAAKEATKVPRQPTQPTMPKHGLCAFCLTAGCAQITRSQSSSPLRRGAVERIG